MRRAAPTWRRRSPGKRARSRPISRVLLRRVESTRYDRHSSRPGVAAGLEPPTRGLGEQRRRPPIWRCSGWRLPRFTRPRLTRGDSSLWPCSSPSPWPRGLDCCGRALPGILLCGARTFLSPRSLRSEGSDDLAGFASAIVEGSRLPRRPFARAAISVAWLRGVGNGAGHVYALAMSRPAAPDRSVPTRAV